MTLEQHQWQRLLVVKRFTNVAVGVFLLGAMLAWEAPVQAKEQVGETAVTQVESPHPYPSGASSLPVVWKYTLRHPGVTFLKIHFAHFTLGSGDIVQLRDANGRVVVSYTGEWNARASFWAPAVDGDTLTIELRADADGVVGDGVRIDRYGYGGGFVISESVCSGVDQKEDIACYAGTPLASASRAVGKMLFEEHGVLYACTGFLVSEQNHFMTNEHCISSQDAVDSLEVFFGYEHTSCGGTTLNPGEVFVGEQLLFADADFDVALLTLQGNPAQTYGFLPLSDREPALGEALHLPQHPSGGAKQVSVTDCWVSSSSITGGAPGSDFGHQCDTENGSSGSPVLDVSNQVIGLHHVGGCTSGGGENYAVLMSRILPQLPLLGHDFAITKIIAPKRVTLTHTQSKTAFVKVQVQNRSAAAETLPDLQTLANLVSLNVESLGQCPDIVPVLHVGKPQKTLPVMLKPKQKLDVVFAVTFACANNSLDLADYRYTATVNHAALDGKPDDHPDDDMCPRSAVKPFTPDPYPDGTIQEKGCGGKTADGAFGADVETDVVVK